MPNYFIADCKAKEFDVFDFHVQKGSKPRQEGKFTYIAYHIDRDKTEQSGVAVVRNFENAITKIGGAVVASVPQRWVNGKVAVDGREIWVEAEKGNRAIWLRIVEKAAMQQHIVPLAGNDDEAGRAKNRRVELVKQSWSSGGRGLSGIAHFRFRPSRSGQ